MRGPAAPACILAVLLMAGSLAGCSHWQPAECEGGLQCPDGATCAADQPLCITTPCGNGVVELGEVCDDGNIIPGDGCDRLCQREGCGNGSVDVGEVCDDGNVRSGDGCSATCRSEYCGNGVINREANEQCDDKNAIPGDDCSVLCLSEWCGNGIVDQARGEVCDDGNIQSGDGCSELCKSEYCGNGKLDGNLGEQCDDGNRVSGDGCNETCRPEYCGNGIVDVGESCDDRNVVPGDGCSEMCESEYCGNGSVDAGEVCDDGNLMPGDGCSPMCRSEGCGDGDIDIELGESCDDDNQLPGDGCSSVCRREGCGNEILDPGETCDDGNMAAGDGCSETCNSEYCGNGIVELGEECEDRNRVSGDGCNSTCQSEYCGNGIVEPGEECDDGNAMAGDSCSNECERTISQLAAGEHHTCALLASGAVRCWGSGGSGQLGYGNTEYIGDDETPASAGDVDVGGPATQLAAGGHHTCALLASGAVRCWGHNGWGQLGVSQWIGDDETPASAGDVDVGGPATQLAAGYVHTCALLASGAVRCWGGGLAGRLGYGNVDNIGDDETPASAGDVEVGGPVAQIVAGAEHTCALLASRAVRCWGFGQYGQLGYGNVENIGDDETPASVGELDVGGPVTQLAAGGYHTCALLANGAVRCWGHNGSGRLGYRNTGNIGDDETPAFAGDVEVGSPVTQLSAGRQHTCALLASGAVRCWGDGDSGRLGYGNVENIGDDETLASAGEVEVGGPVIQLADGGYQTCALLASGAVRCWGDGAYGKLGYGNTNDIGDDETPASVGNVPILVSTP